MSTVLIFDDNIHALDSRETGWVVLPCTTDKTDRATVLVVYFSCSMKNVATPFNATVVL